MLNDNNDDIFSSKTGFGLMLFGAHSTADHLILFGIM